VRGGTRTGEGLHRNARFSNWGPPVMRDRPPGRPVGIAVFGSGSIAESHAQSFSNLQDVEVRWVIGSDASRVQRIASRIPGSVPATHPQDALRDELVDAVVVCGRSRSHPVRTRMALAAGKHVLVEKPPAFSLTEFDGLVELGRSKGCTLMVAQTARFHPAMLSMSRDVIAGAIGRPRLVHASWYVGHVWPGAWNSWQLDPRISGGHALHNGMHPLDMAIWLLNDRPVRVMARGFKTHAPDMPTPDSFHLVVGFAGGGLALLETVYALRPEGALLRRLLLAGTDGTLEHHTGRDSRPPGVAVPPASVEGASRNQAEHFIDIIRGDAEPIVQLNQSRQALAGALAAQRSLETGEMVTVEEVEDAQS
jgi:predicted dehydrogenase